MWQAKNSPDFPCVLFTMKMNPAKIVLQRITYSVKLNLAKETKFDNKTYCEREVMLLSMKRRQLVWCLRVKH